MKTSDIETSVLVACPDARPPAYQAAIGLAQQGLLGRFVTSSYYRPDGWMARLGRAAVGKRFGGIERALMRRHNPEIPADRVRAHPSFDISLRFEARLGETRPGLRRSLAQWRTERFDAQVARRLSRERPAAAILFSDVGSGETLPTCRRLGIPTILSMVHGVVHEEEQVLRDEAEHSPEFLPIYLGNSALDHEELAWLHDRRLRDLELADRVVVPSEHIAITLLAGGTPAQKLRVIPYAADCRRFRPIDRNRPMNECVFLFAGGISQRKGIKYLLEAWQLIRRPGWRLQLLGAMPTNLKPLQPFLDSVEVLGRVSHADVPSRMAAADVFVFPSLFEGSAVVTYEALACGLPSIVTPNAGSVARDGVEGFEVKIRDTQGLAQRMARLGQDVELRARMSAAARRRAEAFDWPRYHAAVSDLTRETISGKIVGRHGLQRSCLATVP